METLTWGLTQKQANEPEEGRMVVEDVGHPKMRRWHKTDIFHPWKLFAVNERLKKKTESSHSYIQVLFFPPHFCTKGD